jgi:outer membrane protein assembly factor BamB
MALGVGAAIWGATAAADEIVDADALRSAGYVQHWQTQVPLGRGGRMSAVYRLQDNLYLTTTEGEVLAVHPHVGLVRWAKGITEPTCTIFRPTHVGLTGPVVFATTSGTTILDRYSGEERQMIPATFPPGGAATADATRLFVGSSDGHLYAMRWHDPKQPKVVRLWKAMTGGVVRATPVFVDDDHLYCASTGGAVYCCTADKKREQWKFQAEAAIAGDMDVEPQGVYVASADRSVYRLDPQTGARRWRRRLQEILEEGPMVLGGIVYQPVPRSGMFAIDAEYGDVLWTLSQGRQIVARNGAQVCVLTEENALVVVDAKTGKAIGKAELSSPVSAALNREDAAIYLVTPLGQLFCARPIGDKSLTPADLEAAHATLNLPPKRRPAATQPTTGASQ